MSARLGVTRRNRPLQPSVLEERLRTLHVANPAGGDILTATDSVVH